MKTHQAEITCIADTGIAVHFECRGQSRSGFLSYLSNPELRDNLKFRDPELDHSLFSQDTLVNLGVYRRLAVVALGEADANGYYPMMMAPSHEARKNIKALERCLKPSKFFLFPFRFW